MSAHDMPPDNIPAFEQWARAFTKACGQPPSERDSFMEGLRQGYDAAMKDFHETTATSSTAYKPSAAPGGDTA